MNLRRFLIVFSTFIALCLSLGAAHADESGSMVYKDELALEVGVVNLVTDSNGNIVQVLVDDCGQCDKKSYLPSRRLIVSKAGADSAPIDLAEFNGRSGTVVLDNNSGMVIKVFFWVPREERI